jgi:hypothetical protein
LHLHLAGFGFHRRMADFFSEPEIWPFRTDETPGNPDFPAQDNQPEKYPRIIHL